MAPPKRALAVTDIEAVRPRGSIGLRELGVTTSTTAANTKTFIQNALDEIADPANGFAELFIDPHPEADGYWEINSCCKVESGTIIRGLGERSHLRNTRAITTISGDGRIFDYGNMISQSGTPGAVWATEPSWAIEPIAAGERTVTLSTAADAADFDPGDIVWCRGAELTGNIFQRLQINLVEAVDTENGILTMRYRFNDAIAGSAPVVCKTDGGATDSLGHPRRLTKNVQMLNFKMSTANPQEGWDAAGGTIGSVFRDLVADSMALIYSNGFSHCQFDNIRGKFKYRLVELTGYSDSNMLRNIEGIYEPGITASSQPLISFGENSNYNMMDGYFVSADECAEANLFRTLFGSYNTLKNGKAKVRGLVGAALYFGASGTDARCKGNLVDGLEIWAGTPSRLLHANHNVAVDEGQNEAHNIRVHEGTPGTAAITIAQSHDMVVKNFTFPSGTVETTAAADAPVLDDITTRAGSHTTSFATPSEGNGAAVLGTFIPALA